MKNAATYQIKTTARYFTVLVMVAASFLTFGGCSLDRTLVSEYSFDGNPLADCTVYVEEAGELVPYLVLTADYNGSGKTLLLRKHVMDEPRTYNPNVQGNSYYAGSEIDEWLSGAYLLLVGNVDAVEVPIEISTKDSLNHCGLDIETIHRKAFLLSWLEVGGPEGVTIAPDGRELAYFVWNKALGTRADGTEEPYALRSPITCANTAYSVVGSNGKFGGAGLEYKLMVRPAFCVESDAEVARAEAGERGRGPVLS